MTETSASPTRVYVFLDTTVLIHGLPIEQLDWTKRFACDEVVLVLATTVMAELDKLKDGADGRFSRDRARDFFARFQKYEAAVLDPPGALVRDRVWLRVLTAEPKLFDGADPAVNDDRIVSAVLGFDTEAGSARLLFARDTNIILKARGKGLRAERLPEDCEVQAEADPVEKKLKAAEKELADLRHRQPKISVLLVHEQQEHPQYVDAVVVDVRLPGDHEVKRHYAVEEEACVARQGGLAFFHPSEEEVREYLSAYNKYLGAVTKVERQLGRRLRFGFTLSNSGAAMASKIEFDVTAGAGIRFSDVDDRPEVPRRPRLRSMLENVALTAKYYQAGGGFPGLLGADRAMRAVRGLYLEPDRAEYMLKEVMHSDRRVLSEFDVVLPDDWDENGFSFEAVLRVAELPKPERLTFNVRTRIERREPFVQASGEDDDG